MARTTSGTPTRVVVWSTGGIGSRSMVAGHERRDLELVGVWVHSADEVGRDVELPSTIPRHAVRA